MNGAFQMGKQALCHQSPVSRLTRSIHGGPELPGSMQCSFIERVLWQVPKSLENLTTVKLKQNSVEGLMELLHASRGQGKSGPSFEARAHVDFHFRYRAEQGELPTRNWKHKVSYGKIQYLPRTMQAVTKTPDRKSVV